VAFGAPLEGRKALRKSFIEFFAAIPDNYTNPVNVLVDGEWAVVEWSGGGTLLGSLGDNPATGKSFQLQGCRFFHVIEGKIKFQRGYIDKHTWFSQVSMPLL
jgi:steroid delta-isomerase-like uncharacterized protein